MKDFSPDDLDDGLEFLESLHDLLKGDNQQKIFKALQMLRFSIHILCKTEVEKKFILIHVENILERLNI